MVQIGDKSKQDVGKATGSSSCAIGTQEMKHIASLSDGPLQEMFDSLTGLLVGYPAVPETHAHRGSQTEHHSRSGVPKFAGEMNMTKTGSHKGQVGDDETKYFQHTGWAKTEAPRVNACLQCLLTDTAKLLTENNIRYVLA